MTLKPGTLDLALDGACGPKIAQIVRTLRAAREDADDNFFDALGAAAHLADEKPCIVAIMAFLAPQVDADSDANFLRSYLMVALAELRHLKSVVAVREALTRIPFDGFYAREFFLTTADFGIDHRPLAVKVLTGGRLEAVADAELPDAIAWLARLHLARFADAEALENLAQRLLAVSDLNMLIHLLADIYWIGTPGSRQLLAQYSSDPRRVPTVIDGRQGPTVGEEVQALIARD